MSLFFNKRLQMPQRDQYRRHYDTDFYEKFQDNQRSLLIEENSKYTDYLFSQKYFNVIQMKWKILSDIRIIRYPYLIIYLKSIKSTRNSYPTRRFMGLSLGLPAMTCFSSIFSELLRLILLVLIGRRQSTKNINCKARAQPAKIVREAEAAAEALRREAHRQNP